MNDGELELADIDEDDIKHLKQLISSNKKGDEINQIKIKIPKALKENI